MGNCAAPAHVGTGDVKILGMAISGNVIPPTLFCLDNHCGQMELMDMMKGEHKTPEKLALNPFGQMPIMKDGGMVLAESNAILRYLGKVYNPSSCGVDIKEQSDVDWAMDWASTNFYKHYVNTWYVVAGFAPATPPDQAKANQEAVEALEVFAKKFLANGKFIGGERLSIADYKVGSWIWYLEHPTMQKKIGYKNPARASQYAKEFYAALSPESKKFLEAATGFMDSLAK